MNYLKVNNKLLINPNIIPRSFDNDNYFITKNSNRTNLTHKKIGEDTNVVVYRILNNLMFFINWRPENGSSLPFGPKENSSKNFSPNLTFYTVVVS